MMLPIEPYEYRRDDAAVRALHAVCHRDWPEPLPWWYCAHPTLVARDGETLAGYTSYALNYTDEGKLTMWGHDTCVAPEYRGQGLATEFLRQRLLIARQLGAGLFAGPTATDNVPMQRILTAAGGQIHGLVRNAYPDGTNAILYIIMVP